MKLSSNSEIMFVLAATWSITKLKIVFTEYKANAEVS
jgi:hypothetical protein